MAGTVTGWRSLPSQPTAASIPRDYVRGFPKARLPFRHLSAGTFRAGVCVRNTYRQAPSVRARALCCVLPARQRAGINRLPPDSLFAAARDLNKVSGHVFRDRPGFGLLWESDST